MSKCTYLLLHTHVRFPSSAQTTLTAIPGVLEIEGARIQLLDLPGIIEGAASGRGRGRQVVAVAKTADLILMILDVKKAEQQKKLLEVELDAIGIRLNRKKPDVLLKPKKAGGVSISNTVPLTKIDEKTIRTIVGGRCECPSHRRARLRLSSSY